MGGGTVLKGNTPDELRERKQWLNWELHNDRKIPTTTIGQWAKTNDPECFSTFQEAALASDKIAYVIQRDDPYVGIDLDNCLDEKGKLREWAIPITTRLDGVAFAEISPSGRGIKFITRGKKHPGCRCVSKFGEDKQQIEVYDFNRFWTITGEVYAGNRDIQDGQHVIDWICMEYLTDHQGAGNLDGFVVTETVTLPGVPLEQRASAYVDAADRPMHGDRNNAAFRLAGHLLSMEENGRSLPASEVTRLVTAWNSTLVSPLPAKEIEAAVKSAAKNGTKREPKGSQEIEVTREPVVPKPQMPSDLLRPPGIISEIIEYTLRTSLYPQPELALAGAIALMGTVTGRKLTDTYGTRTNVYVLGLAPSGSGKEQARKTNKEILHLAEGEHYIGPERVGSSAGLVVALSNQPALLFQLDEIGRLMATIKNPGKAAHLYNIATVLMQIYGSSDTTWIGDAYADTNKVKKINQPHPVVYGTSVPAGFWESLTVENVSDGLLGRMMPFESQAGYVDPQTPERIDPPESLIESIRWWVNYHASGGNLSETNPEPLVVEYTSAAQERFHGHMSEIASRRKREEDQAAALWSRSAGKAGKLALIFAASRCPLTPFFKVEAEDIDRGIRLSNWMTRTIQRKVFEHVSENDQEDRTKKVLRILSHPLTKSQLTRRTQWLKRRERDEILETLIEAGLVSFDTEEAGKTVVTKYKRIST